jgi:hypothetical protein
MNVVMKKDLKKPHICDKISQYKLVQAMYKTLAFEVGEEK